MTREIAPIALLLIAPLFVPAPDARPERAAAASLALALEVGGVPLSPVEIAEVGTTDLITAITSSPDGELVNEPYYVASYAFRPEGLSKPGAGAEPPEGWTVIEGPTPIPSGGDEIEFTAGGSSGDHVLVRAFVYAPDGTLVAASETYELAIE